ncbi:histidine ABC transporter permease HisQ [Pseudaeromonas sp. ZJS20]|uniref:ABC transporter permease n=1 Tax=Pseudaeromonas aegiceratis TaxID=3153928 RepID=UPI00390C7335
MLYGYEKLVLQGAGVTLELALLSLLVAVLLGLLGASAKLSDNRLGRALAAGYTTLIRGVPDLVLMLLIFYGLQIAVNAITDTLGFAQLDIDPFTAGILTIGFIYGAYFAETFRGAFLAINAGQAEAGQAYGFSRWQIFTLILFPQMMRFALPGLANNWLVLLKATALVSIIGLADVVKATQVAGKGTFQFFLFTLVAAAVYLVFTTLSNLVIYWLNRRYALGVRSANA